MEAYLAETLGLVLVQDPFSRSDCHSVAWSFRDHDERVTPRYSDLPTAEARRAAHEKNIVEVIPSFLRYFERFLAEWGEPYFFGDKLTVSDLKLYTVFFKWRDMYGGSNPVVSGQYPKLANVAEGLESGRVADYARNCRFEKKVAWSEEEQKSVVVLKE